jgi:hypothetical protein
LATAFFLGASSSLLLSSSDEDTAFFLATGFFTATLAWGGARINRGPSLDMQSRITHAE